MSGLWMDLRHPSADQNGCQELSSGANFRRLTEKTRKDMRELDRFCQEYETERNVGGEGTRQYSESPFRSIFGRNHDKMEKLWA